MTTASKIRDDRALGFQTLDEEVAVDRLEVQGEVPAWLSGSLVRLSPAGLDTGGQPVRHWFDGLAMLHRFGLRDGEVAYANRWLDTEARRRTLDPGAPDPIGFATDPCRSIFKRMTTLFTKDDLTDNANVNLTRLGERFIAMTEIPLPVEFDPATLETTGGSSYADGLGGMVTTAHPHRDPVSGDLVNYVVHFGARSEYRVYAQSPGSASRRLIAAVPVREPSYMHSFAITERYVVLVEFPLVVNPLRLAFGASSFIESYRWRPERGTQVTVVDKETGQVSARGECEAMFSFHHVNAFERGSEIVIDLVGYDDSSIIDRLFLSELRAGREPAGREPAPPADAVDRRPGGGGGAVRRGPGAAPDRLRAPQRPRLPRGSTRPPTATAASWTSS